MYFIHYLRFRWLLRLNCTRLFPQILRKYATVIWRAPILLDARRIWITTISTRSTLLWRNVKDVLTFCSFRYLTDLKDPKKMGKVAIITRLKYAIAIPSILDGGLSVTFFTASITLSWMFIGISVTGSAISTEVFVTSLQK